MTTRMRRFYFAAMLFLLFSAACAPQGVPATGATPQPTALIVVTPTSPSSVAALQAVPPGPPAMQVGSAYRYFDGALLDAVPDDGPFTMGGGPDEAQAQVTVSNFWIYSTEVTNQMYGWCVSLGKCSPPDADNNPDFNTPQFANYPVVGVTWQQAADYCTFAHGRLPTEAEWEKAASWDAAAKQQRPWPWGDKDPSCDFLNYKYCYGKPGSVLQFGLGRSFYGAYNMEGNVSEWVGDWYQPGYRFSGQDPQGPTQGTQRSIRGAAFGSDAMFASPTRRFFAKPTQHRPDLGFRCVVKDPAYFAPYCQMPVFYGINPAGASSGNPCPDPTLEHQEVCGLDLKPRYFVNVQTGGSTLVQIIGLESCTPGTAAAGVRQECRPGTTIKVNASCGVKPAGSAACPPNYKQDPNDPTRCVSPGGPGACPAGFQYDDSMQCCSAASQGSSLVPLCSVGQHPYNGLCVDDSSALQQPQSITYAIPTAASCLPSLSIPKPGGVTPTNTLVPFPTRTPFPTATPFRTSTPIPSIVPSIIPFPTNTPVPTAQPSNTPQPTATPQPTDTPPPPATDTQAPAASDTPSQ